MHTPGTSGLCDSHLCAWSPEVGVDSPVVSQGGAEPPPEAKIKASEV